MLSRPVCPAIKINYAGPGDLLIRPERDNPLEWQEKFGEFNWKASALDASRDQLNLTKDRLMPASKSAKFQSIISATRPSGVLCSNKGIIVKEYGGEKCTPEWLDMFELSSLSKPLITRIEQRRVRDFNTLHLGDTSDHVLALNHKLKTTHKVDWTWFTFGINDINPSRCLLNSDGDYDIESEANIRRMAFDLSKTRIELVTSMVTGIGSIVSALATLNQGGNAILKHEFENHSISWLWLLNGLFKELLLVKPELSDSLYIVAFDYRGIKSDMLETLYQILRFNRFLKVQPQLFKRTDIPDEFIAKLVEAMTIIMNHQTESIDRQLANYEHYKDFTQAQIHEANQAEQLHNAKDWIKNNNLLTMARNAAISI